MTVFPKLSDGPRFGAALIALLVLGVGLAWARPDLPAAADQVQARLDRAAPEPEPGRPLEQAFVPAHNGLASLEVLAVVYAESPVDRELTLRLLGPDGAIVAARTWTGFQHNQALRLAFLPQPASAGARYRLQIEGRGHQGVTVWAYQLDGYAAGDLRRGTEPVPGDLRFSTAYTYLPLDIVRDSAAGLAALAREALPAWLVLFAPGLLILRVLRRWLNLAPAAERWGAALALSLAAGPALWLWLSAAGLAWSPAGLTAVYAAAGLAEAIGQVWDWRRARRWPRPPAADLALLAVLAAGWIVRWLAIRDLAFPSWVDSPHHLVIARLLAETGRLPAGYQPVMPVDAFTYHFGFHALAVADHWLTALPLPRVFLDLGQMLNGLAALAAATLTQALTGRPRAALGAAVSVALISLFPAYYVSWGRYTQLTGLLILAPLAALTWRLLTPAAAETRGTRAVLAGLLALLVAGLILAHYRVLLFYVTFALVAWVLARGRAWAWLAGAAIGAAVLAAPWLGRLLAEWVAPAVAAPTTLTTAAAYNDFPVLYFQSPLERAWLAASGLALLAGLWRRERAVWTLGGWVSLTFLLLNLGPALWLVNNNAWAISLFLPASAALGWGLAAADVWAAANLKAPAAGRAGLAALLGGGLAGALALAGVLGLRAQIAVANAATVLATAADAEALEWIAAHTPADAVFLVNSWKWQGDLWASPDGGAWLWALTGRPTTMPPVDYWYQPDWEPRVRAFNEKLSQQTDAEAPAFLELLHASGAAYVYIGAHGGTLRPEMFTRSERYQLVFSNGTAWVFAVRAGSQGNGSWISPLGMAAPASSWTTGRTPSAAR